MRSYPPLIVALVSCHAASPPAAIAPRDPRVVDTTEGRVIGKADANGVVAFLGVPYAAPPVGDLRWREAMPPAAHAPLQAVEYRLPCSQIPIPSGSDSLGTGKKIQSSEDCLHLNVWVPPHDAGVRLPAMVWLHGGQYLRGAASQYDGEQLARLGRVVVVTMDYRLGPLGFLAHPALTAESKLHTSGNQALFDHLQGLRWLAANLAAFGGDPARVTLFGESAGSASTCALMASPLARGLFQRAILESDACPGAEDAPALADREAFGRRLADALGCKTDDVATELACMRGKTDDEVMTAIPLAKVLGDSGDGVGYRFNRDGVFLSASPEDALAAGNVARMPVLLGTVGNEMGRYVGSYGVTRAEQLPAVIAKQWPRHAQRIGERYPATTDAEATDQLAAMFSDWGMTCPTRRDARWFAGLGAPTYLYRFLHAPNVFRGTVNGAFHGSELAYLFPSVFAKYGLVYTDDDRKLAELLIGYWARFAATGDPNGGRAPVWPRYDASSDRFLAINFITAAGERLRAAECDLWDQIR